MNKFTVLAQLPRIKRASILLGILFLGQTVQAQKIDFDQSGRRTDEVTQTGFSSWQVGQLSYNGSASTTVNGVRVTVKNSTNGYDLRTGWYKANILKDKLINDGTATCEVLDTTSKWFGVTYPEDRPEVVAKFEKLGADGVYPEKMF